MVTSAKAAGPSEMPPFVLWAQMGSMNRVRWAPEVLRDVAVATNFVMQFALTGFVGCMIARDPTCCLILRVGHITLTICDYYCCLISTAY